MKPQHRLTKGWPVNEPRYQPSKVAEQVLRSRFLLQDATGNVLETPDEMFRRVARHVAGVERMFDAGADVEAVEAEFYAAMAGLEFLPNSPTLMNAGTPIGQLAACFVLPLDDSLEGIFEASRRAATR